MKRPSKPVNRPSAWRALRFVAPLVLLALPSACWHSDPCDPGQIIHDDICYDPPAAPPPPPAKVDGGSGDGGGTAPKPDNFGKACTANADCEDGTAPVCGAPQLPMCIQVNCAAGEENAGACPTGWQCLKVGNNPSVCLKN